MPQDLVRTFRLSFFSLALVASVAWLSPQSAHAQNGFINFESPQSHPIEARCSW